MSKLLFIYIEIDNLMKKKYFQHNEEVLYSKDALTIVEQSEITELKLLSTNNLRNRIRLCTHLKEIDLLHEMIIVHDKTTYVRPHKHLGKSESTHIIEGIVDVVLFDDDGMIAQVIAMGDYASGKPFFYRMATPIYHTLIIRSDFLVFHETTNGPFDKRTTIFAPWAPEDTNFNAVDNFVVELKERVRKKL